MKKACIRSVVQLSLAELEWKDEAGVDVFLRGPPVFIRACLLGQLQHSHLHKPFFPISIDQKLTFDRVLTNCCNPSLFNEVIRGEHVKLEIIQISTDYQGGKVLAKFDCPAHKFLFPEGGTGEDDMRWLILNHSRQYKNPPVLRYSCSTVLLEATVHSPIHIIFPEASSSDESRSDGEQQTPTSLRKNRSPSPQKPRSSRRLFQPEQEEPVRHSVREKPGHSMPPSEQPTLVSLKDSLSAQERLHSLLSSYVEPGGDDGNCGKGGAGPFRVKFKPPSPRFRHISDPTASPCTPPPTPSSPTKHGPYYTSPSKVLGPHDWPECPRRSPEQRDRVRSAPTSPQHHHQRARSPTSPYHRQCVTVPDNISLEELSGTQPLERTLYYKSRSVPDLRPPFIVRHVDDSLLGERNFCGANDKHLRFGYKHFSHMERDERREEPAEEDRLLKKSMELRDRSLRKLSMDRDLEGGRPLHPRVSVEEAQSPVSTHRTRRRLSTKESSVLEERDRLLNKSMDPRVSGSMVGVDRNLTGSSVSTHRTKSTKERDVLEEGGRLLKKSMEPRVSSSVGLDRNLAGSYVSTHKTERRPASTKESSVFEGGSQSMEPRVSVGVDQKLTQSPIFTKRRPTVKGSDISERGSRLLHGESHSTVSTRRSRGKESDVMLNREDGEPTDQRNYLGVHRGPPHLSKTHSSPSGLDPFGVPDQGSGEVGMPGSSRSATQVGDRKVLVSKYLLTQPEEHVVRTQSLAQNIEERIERLMEECCESLSSADDLGEDNLSEELDRLRCSLQGERDQALENSSRLVPDESLTVRIGPRDYWSQRTAELTGRRHGAIFDTTLKKIYNRVYKEASMRP